MEEKTEVAFHLKKKSNFAAGNHYRNFAPCLQLARYKKRIMFL